VKRLDLGHNRVYGGNTAGLFRAAAPFTFQGL
jgi:hypothetical protein